MNPHVKRAIVWAIIAVAIIGIARCAIGQTLPPLMPPVVPLYAPPPPPIYAAPYAGPIGAPPAFPPGYTPPAYRPALVCTTVGSVTLCN